MNRKDANIVSRQEYYDNIITDAAHTTSTASWAQYPTTLQRALAFSDIRLQAYIDSDDQLGIDDTRWVINKIKKEIRSRKR